MREMDQMIKNRLLIAQQTIYNNANPQMEIVAVRPRTAISHERFWQESIVTAGATAVCTSVAIRRTGRWGDTVFVAYVDNTGTLVVKSAPLRFPIRAMSWTTLETIAGCSACALEFDGSFVSIGRLVEYRTESTPWLFYVTAAGQMMAGKVGGPYESLVGANVVAIDAIRGVASASKDIDQGLVVFYVLNDGGVYYNQLIAGVWQGQESVGIAPANAVKVKAERTFDWKIILQVTDSTGALYEIFSRMYASGWNGYEYLKASIVGATIDVTEVYYADYQNPDEYITAGADATVISFGDTMPVLMDAWNNDDGNGDYGKFIMVRWTDSVAGIESNLAAFKIVDDYNVSYYPSAIYKTDYGNRLILEFADFNNAANPISVVYTPGTLVWKDGAAVSASSVDFNATGLVPTYIPAPVVTNIASVDNRTILITFDRPIISIDPGIGLTVTGFEPFASPAGQLVPTTYGIESITAYDEYTIQIYLTYAGRMKHPQGEVTILYTNGLTGPGPTAVAGFSQGFTPTGLTLWFKPNDPEYILVSPQATVTVFDVVYKSAQNGDEYLQAGAYNATITITNVGGLPL